MPASKRKVYWDACVFLAWLYDEPNDASVIEGMEAIVKQVDANEITLITSVVTRTEILEGRMTAEVKKKFDSLFNRRNVVMINLDHRISDLSHEIRNFYDRQGNTLSTNDCHHLATAIIHNADEFQTLDGSGKKKKGKLLPISGNIADKYPLKIVVPSTVQPSLFTGVKLDDKESGKNGGDGA